MIPYHGLPITPHEIALRIAKDRHLLVSMSHRTQLFAVEAARSFCVDNGAFSAWRQGEPITDWEPYYDFVGECRRNPKFDFAFIPDVIGGTREQNYDLIAQWRHRGLTEYGCPVWHPHEPASWLLELSRMFVRVAIGGSDHYPQVGSDLWWARITEVMNDVCPDGVPPARFHGLRMLNPKVYSRLPLASADSSSIGRNIGIDQNWKGTLQPATKGTRALVLADRLECGRAPLRWEG